MRIRFAVAAVAATATLLSGAPAEATSMPDRWRQLPACANDEWTGPEQATCVWDARHQGNGKGDSIRIAQDGTVKVLRHRRAHRLIEGFEVPLWEPCFWNGVRWNAPCVHDSRHPVSTGGGDIPAHTFDGSFKMGDFNGDGYIDIRSITHRRAHFLLGLS